MTIHVKIEHLNETINRDLIVDIYDEGELVYSYPIGPGLQRSLTIAPHREFRIREDRSLDEPISGP